jgi:Putative zinc-finger
MRNMNERPVCHRAEDVVTYLYGEASAADAQDFAAHMKQCDACRAEFSVFNQVHESILLWRSEALGSAFNPVLQMAADRTNAASEPAVVQHARRLSGLDALREFFSVSPLWLRGTAAFAALLLCVLGVMTIARLSHKSGEMVKNNSAEKVYTQRQLEAEVKTAVANKEAELVNKRNSTETVNKPTRSKSNGAAHPIQLATNRQPKNQRPRGLSRQERQQLAADLRLTPADEEELPFALPEQERPQ